MREAPQISMHNVTVLYGERPVVDDVSLQISSGKTTVIIGPAGSGKSILLKVMAGLLPPNRGTVRKDGTSMIQLSESEEREFRRRCGFVFQDGALWANRSIAENVRFPLEVHFPHMSDAEKDRLVETYLREVGYEDRLDYRPSQISAGEQKMVSFARALITNPDFLFLDTPLVGIDTTSAESIQEIIKRLHRDGTTIVGGFMDPELISLIADDLIILNKGSVVTHGSFREVRESSNPVVQRVLRIVLQQAASYDEDILSLLDSDENLL